MRVALAAAIVCLVSVLVAGAEERHTMTGVVLSIDRHARSMMVSTDAVPGFMAAMAMSVGVRDAAALDGVKPGSRIEFVYVGEGQAWRAENIRIRGFETLDRKQLDLQRLKVLSGIANPGAAAEAVPVGQRIPDFTLTDQAGQRVTLSSLSGKVVALTFGYVRCPNPAYCFRLASNLGQLQKELKDRVGRDLILLTIVLDPAHDQGQALLDYARVWTSEPRAWHFLTGPTTDARRVAGYFGVEFWKDEGAVIHSLNTAIIDRQGRLAANLEGNAFTARQLVDLVTSVLMRQDCSFHRITCR
jgi:protein SCO1/2